MSHLDRESQLAQALNAMSKGDIEQAETLCRMLLTELKNDPRVLLLFGRIMMAHYNFDEAEPYLKKCLKLAPKEPAAQLCFAQLRQAQGRFREAIRGFEKLLRLQPDHLVALIGKAEALQWQGDFEKSLAVLEPMVGAKKDPPEMAHVHAGSLLRLRRFEEAIAVASRHLQDPDISPPLLNHLHLLIGEAHEKLGQPDDAFDAYRLGNEAITIPSNAEARLEVFESLLRCFTTDLMARMPRSSSNSELPVFIVGMPRCGSTLVETIIDAHPRARGIGETGLLRQFADSLSLRIPSTESFPECMGDMDQSDVDRFGRELLEKLLVRGQGVKRVIEKTLTNFELLGLIEILLPGARVIHCRRDPLNTCLSCYSHPLPLPGHAYACHLDDLGRVYEGYLRVVDHYQSVGSIPLLEVQYEDLVANQEIVSRRIIDFVGLEWHDLCLRFHQSGRKVLTLSQEQVSQPIYTSSVDRARRFGTRLDPLRKSLGDLSTTFNPPK